MKTISIFVLFFTFFCFEVKPSSIKKETYQIEILDCFIQTFIDQDFYRILNIENEVSESSDGILTKIIINFITNSCGNQQIFQRSLFCPYATSWCLDSLPQISNCNGKIITLKGCKI